MWCGAGWLPPNVRVITEVGSSTGEAEAAIKRLTWRSAIVPGGVFDVTSCATPHRHPSRVGVEDASDKLPVGAPLRKALDTVHDLRSNLTRLSLEKGTQKDLAGEVKRLNACAELDGSLIYALMHGGASGDAVLC